MIDAAYLLGAKSVLAAEIREGLGRCMVLRHAWEPEGAPSSEVIACSVGDGLWAPTWGALKYGEARSVYRFLHGKGLVSYSGARTHDDRPIWAVEGL